jgi:hypothetical protein
MPQGTEAAVGYNDLTTAAFVLSKLCVTAPGTACGAMTIPPLSLSPQLCECWLYMGVWVYPGAIIHKLSCRYSLNYMELLYAAEGFSLVARDKYHNGCINGGVR